MNEIENEENKEKNNMPEEKQTLWELMIGTIAFVFFLMLGNLLVENPLAYTVGLILGGAVSIGMSVHMYSSLQKAVLYDRKNAEKKIKIGSLIRMAFMLIALVVSVIVPQYISLVGVALGILSLKFSAYLQPLTHKVLKKIRNKGR